MLSDEKKAESEALAIRIRDGLIHTHRMSHGSVVASAAAILDKKLEMAVKTKLPSINKKLAKQLFEDFRPLGSFAAKIDLAHALDITSDSVYAELQKIRKIRNEFAHSEQILSLDVEPMKSLFMGLKRPASASDTYTELFMACVIAIDDYLNTYLVRTGIVDEETDTKSAEAEKEPPGPPTKRL